MIICGLYATSFCNSCYSVCLLVWMSFTLIKKFAGLHSPPFSFNVCHPPPPLHTHTHTHTHSHAHTQTHTPIVHSTMKVVFLLALVGVALAFDFPEEWEAWKQVGSSSNPPFLHLERSRNETFLLSLPNKQKSQFPNDHSDSAL